jgi:DNA-binding SARP family transcriptional activator
VWVVGAGTEVVWSVRPGWWPLEEAFGATWARWERDRYRDRVVRARCLLATDLLAEGALPAAIRQAEEALTLAPHAEEAARLIMLAYHGLGQSDAARRSYSSCRHRLADELGVDPTSEAADLASAIDAGAPFADLLAQQVAMEAPGQVGAKPPAVLDLRLLMRVFLDPSGEPRVELADASGVQ